MDNDLRRRVFERDSYTCSCGARGGPHGEAELHLDHIVPRAKGGRDTLANLRTRCATCHARRHGNVHIAKGGGGSSDSRRNRLLPSRPTRRSRSRGGRSR